VDQSHCLGCLGSPSNLAGSYEKTRGESTFYEDGEARQINMRPGYYATLGTDHGIQALQCRFVWKGSQAWDL
jgi:hypothetical protein